MMSYQRQCDVITSHRRQYDVILAPNAHWADILALCLFCIVFPFYTRPFPSAMGWSGGAMVLGKLPVPVRPTLWITVGQGPTALAVGADGGCLDFFYSHLSFLSSFSLSWETARYRRKYCLKGPLTQKQPTNQPTHLLFGIWCEN